MCSSCLASVPSAALQLLATAAALVCGQRYLFRSAGKWTSRISFGLSSLVSFALAALGIFLLVLATNDDYRRRNFVSFMVRSGLRSTPLDEHRCGILDEGGVHGNVLEFGPGPGTNFKCFQNTTAAHEIQKYVAVEPNTHFEEEITRERDARGLDFLLQFVGIKGEDVQLEEDHSYDVVVLTHVLCSVDSIESVLANADRALKPGGKIIFMEHVLAEEGTGMRYVQNVVAPFLYIVGNGCTFKDAGSAIRDNLGDRFDVQVTDFDAPLPKPMFFIKPHVKGIAVKK